MTLLELLTKHSINVNHLARRIGMKPGTFSNKLHGRLGTSFTDPELVQVWGVLDEMRKDIQDFIAYF